MESFEESNCQSMSDSFSLYERYMRSFNVADSRIEDNCDPEASEPASSSNSDSESSNSRGNIDLSTAQSNVVLKRDLTESDCNNQGTCDIAVKSFGTQFVKVYSSCTSPAASLLELSSATNEHSLMTDKSNQTDVQFSSEETKRESFKQPIFLTSTMENSNNAVDSVPMFRDVRNGESVFKLPISELSFNGTIKHVQKLKPIVDPISAMSSNQLDYEDKYVDQIDHQPSSSEHAELEVDQKSYDQKYIDVSEETNVSEMNRADKTSESTGDSQYEEFNIRKEYQVNDDASTTKWNLDQSHSSFEASFDSGVRSPDMFSDNGDDEAEPVQAHPEYEPFWSFLKDYETYDRKNVRKIEETLQGVLPPPSVTIIKTDVTEMLKKYYSHLPRFTENAKLNVSEEANSMTPTKRVSFVEIPDVIQNNTEDLSSMACLSANQSKCSTSKDKVNGSKQELDTSSNDKTIDLKMCTEIEATETAWPDTLKCRHYDVYYNVTKYSEKFQLLSQKYGERYVGAETDTSVNIYSGGFQSPSSANKRKALRLKMAQAKSPGRRLSHLARRRQAFCSAATINEKAQASTAKMVLIDKNYFPHRKLINSAERKSPRYRRTPGRKTPTRKTPGKKTPAKTPKTRSGGSSKKKAMRRLLMDSDSTTRSQPTRETLKRALFISPENRKTVPPASCTSVPLHAMKTKRMLFGSPERPAETKSSDGSSSCQFLKRKLDALDGQPESSRSKIAKSLSFGGDIVRSQSISLNRRASEILTAKRSTEMNENHKQKLLWAVSEALRIHGWRMSSPGFREKASTLARLTRKLLTLPPHAAKLATTNLSTSDTMLKIARQYVFAIIQGRTVDECFQEEQMKIANDVNSKVSGYISANAYQQIRARQTATNTITSQIKENSCSNMSSKLDQPKSGTKNVLQDKLVNIDSNSNSSSGLSSLDKASLGLFKSNSMPSFEEAAKMRARRQISFDNVDFPKR